MQDPRPINTNIKTKLINPQLNTGLRIGDVLILKKKNHQDGLF